MLNHSIIQYYTVKIGYVLDCFKLLCYTYSSRLIIDAMVHNVFLLAFI